MADIHRRIERHPSSSQWQLWSCSIQYKKNHSRGIRIYREVTCRGPIVSLGCTTLEQTQREHCLEQTSTPPNKPPQPSRKMPTKPLQRLSQALKSAKWRLPPTLATHTSGGANLEVFKVRPFPFPIPSHFPSPSPSLSIPLSSHQN